MGLCGEGEEAGFGGEEMEEGCAGWGGEETGGHAHGLGQLREAQQEDGGCRGDGLGKAGGGGIVLCEGCRQGLGPRGGVEGGELLGALPQGGEERAERRLLRERS